MAVGSNEWKQVGMSGARAVATRCGVTPARKSRAAPHGLRTFNSSYRAVVVTILIVGANGKFVMLPLPVTK